MSQRLDAGARARHILPMESESSERPGHRERLERADRREFGHVYQRGTVWWIRYRVNGREHRESSHSMSRRQAERLLEQRKGQLDVDSLTPPAMRSVTYEELEKFVRNDYRKAERRSLSRVEHALTHLRGTFGGWRALAITSEQIEQYELDRLDAGAARATVNYELAMLRRAFRLAVKARRLSSTPVITISAPKNARTGFFEPADFALVLAQLPGHLRPVMRFAYLTGWRVKSEVLPLTWDRVDFDAGIVSLYHSKNDEPRVFPFDALPELQSLLEAQRAATTELERSAGRIIPYVFHRNGKGLKSYRSGWAAAVRRASQSSEKGALTAISRPRLAGRIVHDFRRTAVRNLVRAGVDEQLAMKLTGHKTRAVFDRYRITNEADLRAGVEKLASYLNATTKKPAKGTTGAQSGKKRQAGGR